MIEILDAEIENLLGKLKREKGQCHNNEYNVLMYIGSTVINVF